MGLGSHTGGVRSSRGPGSEETETGGEAVVIYRIDVIPVLGTNGEVDANHVLLPRSAQQGLPCSEPA